jgi:8-amino-7-oxononanoate synthase
MSGPNTLDATLLAELGRLDSLGLRRRLRTLASAQGPEIVLDGRPVVNFSSNDYLGLAREEFLAAEFCRAVRDFGAGSGSSRLISGTQSPHRQLEESLAAFKNLPAAIVFGSGHTTAIGTIPALVGSGDVVILDKLAHACLVDGARLSGAVMRVFPHNRTDVLESHLQWARRVHPSARLLVVTESVFSMDGDLAPLEEIVRLKDRHGAWLLLDEAHGLGVIGADGRGLAHALGLAERVEIHMGTLGKAAGVAGGYIAGSRALADYLVNKSRGFIFSTAMPAAVAAAARAAIDWLGTPDGRARVAALESNRRTFAELCPGLLAGPPPSAIVPIIVGGESRALGVSARCLEAGAFVPPVRFPAVPKGSARLRLTLTATHTREHLALAADVLSDAVRPGASPCEPGSARPPRTPASMPVPE